MPLYSYRCAACGVTQTLLRKIADADKEALCPNPACGQLPGGKFVQYAMERQIDLPAVQFKGPGVTRGSSAFGRAAPADGKDGGGGAAEKSAPS